MFISRLQEVIDAGKTHVDMVSVLKGDWELMCFSHPYDGPLHLKKYGRTYPVVADSQDGAWGFLLIRADGSYESVSGSGRDGFEFDANLVCVERKNAKFEFVPAHKQWVHAS